MLKNALLIALLAACGDKGGTDPGTDDGSTDGTDDSGTSDSGTSDSGTSDSGTSDSGSTDDTDSGATDSGATDSGDPAPGVAVELSTANPLAAIVTITTEARSRPVVVATRDGTPVARVEADDDATSHELVLFGLYADSDHELTVSWGDEEEVLPLTTAPLPAGLPDWVVSKAGEFDGLLLLPNGNGPIPPEVPLAYGLDDQGDVRWLYLSESAFVELDPDVERLDDGSLRVLTPKWARRVDMAGRTLDQVSADDVGIDAIHHDARYLDDGGWMLLAHDYRDIPTPDGGTEAITGDQLVRTDADGTVTWTWSTFDHISTDDRTELSSLPGPGVIGTDWTHANAMIHIESLGGWLLSMRNLHRLVLIDADSGDILWSMGEGQDFVLDDSSRPGQWFYGQHAPEWSDDDTLLLFDNGLGRPDGDFSRAARYRVDVEGRTMEEIWAHDIRGFSSAMGDVDTISDTAVLVNAGALSDDVDTPMARVRIVTNDGEIAWQLDIQEFAYRAELVPFD